MIGKALASVRRGLAAVPGDELTRTLGRGAAAALLIRVAAAGLAFVMFVALARAMTLEDYGLFAFGFSLAGLLAVAGSFGQRMLVVRFASAYQQSGSDELRVGVVRDGYRLVTIGCTAMGGGALLCAHLWPGVSTYGHVVGAAGLALAIGLAEYQSHVLRALGGVTLALAPRDLLWRLLVIAAAAAIVFGLVPPVGAAVWLWALALSLLVIVAGQALLHPATRPRALFKAAAAYERDEWRQARLALWAASVVHTGGAALAVILLEGSLGPEAAGPFFAALRTAQLLNLLLLATNIVSAPLISREITSGNWAGVQRICTLVSVGAGGFALLAFLVVLFQGSTLLGLFGSDFAVAAPALALLAAGYLVNTVAGPVGALLQMSGNERIHFWTLLAGNGLGLAALPVGVQLFGMVGAALILSLATVTCSIAGWAFARRRLGVDPSVVSVFQAPHRDRNPDPRV